MNKDKENEGKKRPKHKEHPPFRWVLFWRFFATKLEILEMFLNQTPDQERFGPFVLIPEGGVVQTFELISASMIIFNEGMNLPEKTHQAAAT